jgi:NADH:ubiquinone reductase (H+-translocating)
MSSDGTTRILILGGGFGGLYAAMHLEKTLARGADVEITLINRDNFFPFTPMLHEVAASDLDLTHIVNPVQKLLRRVKFFAGDVEAIDLPGKRVVVSHGFDHTTTCTTITSSSPWGRSPISSTCRDCRSAP